MVHSLITECVILIYHFSSFQNLHLMSVLFRQCLFLCLKKILTPCFSLFASVFYAGKNKNNINL